MSFFLAFLYRSSSTYPVKEHITSLSSDELLSSPITYVSSFFLYLYSFNIPLSSITFPFTLNALLISFKNSSNILASTDSSFILKVNLQSLAYGSTWKIFLSFLFISKGKLLLPLYGPSLAVNPHETNFK